MELSALWLIYAIAVALALGLASRFVEAVPPKVGPLLALLPLVFTGKAMLLGRLYGPADLYFVFEPWKRVAAEHGIAGVRNPILSDLAFANLPWRAAVREALVNGRFPFWNRFVLAGNPLLGSASASVFHPSTWLGVFLPLPLSWTFSCTYAIFLSLLSAFLFFRDFRLSPVAASIGASAWGFSTYLLFWNGWSVGLSTASLPLLLLGLRRIADGRPGVGVSVAGFLLSFSGGHPESTLHVVAAGAIYFLWELAGARPGPPRRRMRALGSAAVAGILALLFSGPQLLPLLEAIPHTAEYRARTEALARGRARQSVSFPEATERLLPAVLPFAYGIYGKSPVQDGRGDGSGMPLAYGGALLFPLAALAFRRDATRIRGRWIFLGFFLAGLMYGASFPVIHDLTSRLPGFELALNWRLVFLSGIGLAGLAALGARELETRSGARSLVVASCVCAVALSALFSLVRPVFAARGLTPRFVWTGLAFEVAPLVLIALAGMVLRPPAGRRLAGIALVFLAAQRALEMGGVYPTLPASTLAPSLPTFGSLPLGSDPSRLVAAGDVLRPNGATLYGLEDVRGYESIVLDRFSETYPLWSAPQPASFNRVDDLTRPFLNFLNARYAIAGPRDPPPAGWKEQARGPEMAVFENTHALPRAFVPRRLRHEPDAAKRLAEMKAAADFSETAWLSAAGTPEETGGKAALRVRAAGPDLVVAASVTTRAFVATSLPDWPGWIAEEDGRALPLATVNHAFIGFWLPPGEHTLRLRFRPPSWGLGLAAFSTGLAAVAAVAARRAR